MKVESFRQVRTEWTNEWTKEDFDSLSFGTKKGMLSSEQIELYWCEGRASLEFKTGNLIIHKKLFES